MEAAEVCLVVVVIRRAEPLAGEAALGDGLEISLRGIDFVGGFLDEAGAPIGGEQVGEGFFFGEVEGFLDLATVEGILFLGNLKGGAAAGALGEDDLCDIEEWIDAGDLVDFLADELDGVFLRGEGDGDALGGGDLLAAEVISAACVAVEVAAVSSALAAIASAVIAATASASAFAGIAAVVPAAWLEIARWEVFVFFRGGIGLGACPGGTEREFG